MNQLTAPLNALNPTPRPPAAPVVLQSAMPVTTKVNEQREFFAETDEYTVAVGDFDDSRAAIYEDDRTAFEPAPVTCGQCGESLGGDWHGRCFAIGMELLKPALAKPKAEASAK